jgi:deazaflavin-dependent oxidoreductase (nitroreductase family)
MLEVVDHPSPGRYVVVSGFGAGAQWVRNITADPRVLVSVGPHPARPARAHRLDLDEVGVTLTRFAARHSRSWERLRPILQHTSGSRGELDESRLVMVALDVEGSAATDRD